MLEGSDSAAHSTVLQQGGNGCLENAIEVEANVKRLNRGLAMVNIQIFRPGNPPMRSAACRKLFAEMTVMLQHFLDAMQRTKLINVEGI